MHKATMVTQNHNKAVFHIDIEQNTKIAKFDAPKYKLWGANVEYKTEKGTRIVAKPLPVAI